MSWIAKFLVAVCTFLMLTETASIEAAAQGFMEGHLKVVSMRAVEPDEMSLPDVAPESYATYPLIILRLEGRKEIARLTADANRNYRAALPPGAYILDVQDRVAKHIGANPQPFTVISNQTVRVDIKIFAGFHKAQA
jgi:hypothetical protein